MDKEAVFIPKDLLDLGSRAAVDRTLAQLVRKGTIRRLLRGIYDYPAREPDPTSGIGFPSAFAIAHAAARATGDKIQMTGAEAAYHLGWSPHVPARAIYHTTGGRRIINYRDATIELRSTCPKYMMAPGTRAGEVMQALRFMGPKAARDFIPSARAALTPEDLAFVTREASRTVDWLRPILQQVANTGTETGSCESCARARRRHSQKMKD